MEGERGKDREVEGEKGESRKEKKGREREER